ncbi:MAG: TonB-dependent receptor [Ralstonia sp.]|jgi:catecholate siderophore receptor|uniref:TonB-dependent receptor n=2 Tax=Ralstonia TaxID=48736 RepID=UPI00397A7F91
MQAAQTERKRAEHSVVGYLTGAMSFAVASAPAMADAGADVVTAHLPEQTVTGSAGFKTDEASGGKFTAPLLDTPKSVTVIPAEVLQDSGSVSLTEALRTVPGIAFGAGEGGNPVGDRPFIRGYDAQASTFLDGLRDIGAQSRDMFNVESVEVVKGPSGAYEGRGSAGGAINLVSKAPKLETFTEGTVSVGNAAYKRATADGNYQIGEHAAFRLNAMFHDAGVPGRDVTSFSRWGVAPSIAFGLGTPTRATLSTYHLQSNDTPDTGIPYNNGTFNRRTDGRPQLFGPGDGAPVGVDRSTYYGLSRDFRRDQVDMGTLVLEHDFSNALKLRNTTRIARTNQDYVWTQPDDSQGNIYYGMVWRRANTRYSTANTIANQTELTGKLETGGLKHSYAAGLEFSRERSSNDTYNVAAGSNRCPNGTGAAGGYNCTSLFSPNPNDPLAGSIARANNPAETTVRTQSAYVFDTIELSPRWQINGGLRYDRYSASATTSADAKGVRTSFSRDDNLLNYQFGLVFKPAQNGSIYVAYGTSSTPSGSMAGQGQDPNGLTPDRSGNNGNVLAPEKNRAYELGTKWNVLDNKLALTAAIFRIETTNARIILPGGFAAMAGDKRVDGFELGWSGALTNQWQVFGGYTYLKSELRNNGGAGAAFGMTNGQEFPNTPKNSFSLWTTYQPTPKWTLGGGAYYVSKVWGSQATNKWVPAYWRFDAMAAYRIDKHTSLQLNVQNLFNKTYFNQAYTSHYASIAPGRAAILTLGIRY